MKIDFEEYKRGKWVDDDLTLTAEETYDLITPDLSDIVSSIKIDYQGSNLLSDGYYTETISPSNSSAFQVLGVNITRCDYYWYLKCFCLVFEKVYHVKLNFFYIL